MKNSMLRRTLTLIASIALAFAAQTAQADLTIGDPAPKFQVGKWIQGEPVKEFDTNHVYIVDFWATWCPYCLTSIPHLNELWQKFKDKGVIVIGQDVWEQNDSAVAPLVKKMGTNMTYRVALDDTSKDLDGYMSVHWWKRGTNYHGIPTAFVINKQGLIAWIGFPTEVNEKLLDDILSGHYDMAKAAAEYEKQRAEDIKLTDANDKLFSAIKQKNWDAADAAAAEVEKILPEKRRPYVSVMRLKILLGRKDYDGGYKLAESSSDAHQDKAGLQNELAWTLVTTEGVDRHGLVLAENIAEHANKAANGKVPAILDTLARAQFMSGMTNEAVMTEQKALELAPDEQKPFIKKLLTDYQQGKLPEINQ